MSDQLSFNLPSSCALPPGSKVFTYARDSGGETQERSVDEQIRLYDAYSKKHDLIIVRHFHDRARPGSTMVGRDGLEQLLAEARRQPRQASGILFWALDRLSRNQLESQYLKADLRLRGYHLVFLSNDIPEAGDFSHVFEAFFEWKAQEDLKTISRNARRGLQDLVARKKPDGSYEGFMPGIPPRGFKGEPIVVGTKRNGKPRVNQRWVRDPAWWGKCQKAFQLRASSWTVASIHRKFHLFRKSGCYTTFFRNPIYKGELHYGGMILKDFVPRMVDDDTWSKVQRMHEGLKKHAPARVDSKRLFMGLVFCAVCGAPLRGYDYRKGGRLLYQYYGCTGREKKTCKAPMISAEPFEREVVEKICRSILTVETLRNMSDALRRQWDQTSSDAGAVVDLLRDELKVIEKAIQNLVASGQAAPLSKALGKALEDQEKQAEGIRAQIAELQEAGLRKPVIPEYTDADLSTLADQYREYLRQPTEGSRAALRYLISRIVADAVKKNAMIYYRFPIEGSAADPGGASFFLRSARKPVGAPATHSGRSGYHDRVNPDLPPFYEYSTCGVYF